MTYKKKTQFFVGGYCICTPTYSNYMHKEVSNIKSYLSFSDCISSMVVNNNNINFISKINGIDWRDRNNARVKEYTNITGLDHSRILQLNEEITSHYSKGLFGYKYFFTDKNAALHIYDKYFLSKKDVYVLGIGIDEKNYEIFTKQENINDGWKHYGIYSCLRRNEKMECTNVLGYDVLGYSAGGFYSFLCNNIQDELEYIKIHLNNYGLFRNYDDAVKVINHIYNENIPREEGLWLPWIVCKYN